MPYETDGELVSTVKLREKSDKISCYVRAQLKGRGGICMTQPFICDDGDMARFRKPIPAPKKLTKAQQIKKKLADTRPGVILFRMIMGEKTNV